MNKEPKQPWLTRKLWAPLLGLLKQGVSPGRLAFTVALGALLGLFPIVGTTTVLCTLAALGFRLNLAAIQLANYFVYPLQVLLILPFIRLGQWMVGAEPLNLTLDELRAQLAEGVVDTMWRLGASLWHGVLGWALCAGPLLALLYWVLLRLIAWRQENSGPQQP